MSSNRREFIERLGATAMLGVLPATAFGPPELEPVAPPRAEGWDFSWTRTLGAKKHKAVFDCTEVESGHGVWRASIWERQYQEALGAKPGDIRTVLLLRHNAVVLSFRQDLWDQAGLGPLKQVTHALTQQPTTRNPVLLSSATDGVPEMVDTLSLPSFISRGGIVLACNLALENVAGGWAGRAGISRADAIKRMADGLVPGVVLMPSGVLAAVKAQEEGCVYVKAS